DGGTVGSARIHGAELQDTERTPLPADPGLTEENRAARGQLDAGRDRQEERRQGQQTDCGGGKIERALSVAHVEARSTDQGWQPPGDLVFLTCRIWHGPRPGDRFAIP